MSRSKREFGNEPIFRTYQKSHENILANENWFGDGKPTLGKQFTVEETEQRKADVIDILFRTAKRERRIGNSHTADGLAALADQIFQCRTNRRCGSLACPVCQRAFQKAKVAAQRATIEGLKAARKNKLLVMVTIIPLMVTYRPDELPYLNVQKLNRWLKDTLTKAAFKRVMLGSIDISWENGLYQPHWHIAMWTANPKKLTRRLKRIFPALQRGDRPVMASKTYSLGFLPYKNKVIKLPDLLRNNRRGLAYLLLALNQAEPLELMVLSGLQARAQNGGFEFKKINRR